MIDDLCRRGAAFVTWHDLLDGRPLPEFGIILQLDVDGGPRSSARMVESLRQRDVRANIMTHRDASPWYVYGFDELPMSTFAAAEGEGWVIGYHNNALTQEQGEDHIGDYSEPLLTRARARFIRDVDELRRWFNVRVFTHHGGLTYNNRMGEMNDVLVNVDKRLNPRLWERVSSSFSDGGFLSRPVPLHLHTERLEGGLHFIRCHPAKYANFPDGVDVPPASEAEAPTADDHITSERVRAIEANAAKSAAWLSGRIQHRLAAPPERRWGDLTVIDAAREAIRRAPDQRAAEARQRYPSAADDPYLVWASIVARLGSVVLAVEPPVWLTELLDMRSLSVRAVSATEALHLLACASQPAAGMWGLEQSLEPRTLMDALARQKMPMALCLPSSTDPFTASNGKPRALWGGDHGNDLAYEFVFDAAGIRSLTGGRAACLELAGRWLVLLDVTTADCADTP